MITFIPKRNNGFSWFKSANIYVKGYLFDKNDRLYTGYNLLKYFERIEKSEQFEKVLNNANGLFSIVIIKDNYAFIGNDNILFFPLFYHLAENDIIISDDPYVIQNQFGLNKIKHIAIDELRASGYISGHDTFIEQLYQTEAGSYLEISNNKAKNHHYYRFSISRTSKNSYSELSQQLIKIYKKIFTRLIKSANNRQIAVALSGGFDSRMIAVMLRELDYQNVILFTYGRRKNNPELKIAEKVAKALNYKWYFIEYNEKLINDYFQTQLFKNYYKYAFNYTSMFFMHEYFAVKYLKENNLINDDTIFVPGHSGDFIAGSQLIKNGISPYEKNLHKVIDNIVSNKYYLTKHFSHKAIREKVKQRIIEEYKNDPSVYLYSLFENWDFKEKFAKYITRSTHVFHYFGYEVRTPYWDKEFVDFFKYLPYEFRLNKKLYDDVLTNNYFNKYGILYSNKVKLSRRKVILQHLKDKIKPYLPEKYRKKLLIKIDTSAYHIITAPLRKEIIENMGKMDRYMRNYNAVITTWLIMHTKKELNNN